MKLTSKQYEILARLVAAEMLHVRHNLARSDVPALVQQAHLDNLQDIADTIERAANKVPA